MDINNLKEAAELNDEKRGIEILMNLLKDNTDKGSFECIFTKFMKIAPEKADAMFAIMRKTMIEETKKKYDELIDYIRTL